MDNSMSNTSHLHDQEEYDQPKLQSSEPSTEIDIEKDSSSPSPSSSSPKMSPPAPPKSHLVFSFLKRPRSLPSSRLMAWMLFGLFTVMFLAGWNDASQGPLLPSLQAFYNVNYLIISIIWIANFIGFLLAGIFNVIISDRFGFGIAAPFGAVMQGLGYVFMCWGGPYPLFVCSYLAIGFGLGLQDAQVNSLASRLPNASPKMFLLHAIYGLGATISPLVSTAFVQHLDSKVYTYFAVSLGLAILTALLLVIVFKGRTEDQVVGERLPDEFNPEEREKMDRQIEKRRKRKEDKEGGGGRDLELQEQGQRQNQMQTQMQMQNQQGEVQSQVPLTISGQDLAGEKAVEVVHSGGSGGKMKRIMKTPAVHFMAFYIMIYVGVEVTIGGWATSFIIDERGGNDNAGYVTTGYFGGLTLGRVVLIPVTKWLGNRKSIYVYSILAIALELIVWFTHSIPGNAVCFAFVGFFLGPMYPIVMMVITEILPGDLQAGTIGWVASLGQAGSAIMPFITGAIADRYGVWVLQPLAIAFLVADMLLFALVPRHRKAA